MIYFYASVFQLFNPIYVQLIKSPTETYDNAMSEDFLKHFQPNPTINSSNCCPLTFAVSLLYYFKETKKEKDDNKYIGDEGNKTRQSQHDDKI